MSRSVKGVVVAGAILLAGCATSAPRQADVSGNDSKSQAKAMRTCEDAVYYSSEYDREQIIGCANALDVWQ